MKKIIVALLLFGSFAESTRISLKPMSLRQWQFQMKPRNRYCYFFTVAMGADGVFVLKRGFKTKFATWARKM
jgi:hypothetical protein